MRCVTCGLAGEEFAEPFSCPRGNVGCLIEEEDDMSEKGPLKWTLVRHSGYSVGGKPEFEHAVEERSVTVAQAKHITKFGGLVFDDYHLCRERGQAENYPNDVGGLVPKAKGKFLTGVVDDEEIYLPVKEKADAGK